MMLRPSLQIVLFYLFFSAFGWYHPRAFQFITDNNGRSGVHSCIHTCVEGARTPPSKACFFVFVFFGFRLSIEEIYIFATINASSASSTFQPLGASSDQFLIYILRIYLFSSAFQPLDVLTPPPSPLARQLTTHPYK